VLVNFAGKHSFSHFGVDFQSGIDVAAREAPAHDMHSIVVPDAQLLFSGDYKRLGADLVLSKDGHDHVVQDYFRSQSRATLTSPDGARLTGDLVTALTGNVQMAQLGGAPAAAAVIGHVTKLTGGATAIRNGVSVMLSTGDNVHKGDVVQCGSDSSLGLTFIDGTVFGLSANARMVLNEMVYDPNGSSNSSLLSLVQGTITFVAGETAKHGDMRVDTPVATMGIHGTAVLVEIGFEVPSQGNAPPVKFQVLVEPGGRVGSYLLYSKSDPTSVIGTISQAGLVTAINGFGDTATTPAPVLSPEARNIIQQTLQIYFPNYIPNLNPPGGSSGAGSTPSTPVPNTLDRLPNLQIDTPNQVPIKFDTPGSTPGAPSVTLPITVAVTVTPHNTPPLIEVINVVDKANFNIADQVRISDPNIGDGRFNDVVTRYVAGTARVVSATGPPNRPGLDFARLIDIDPLSGAVGYDPAAFRFLAAGASMVFVIAFDSRSGPDTVHETLTYTITGVNDAPVIEAAHLSVVRGGTVVLGLADISITDPDSTSFTYFATSTHGSFQITADGINWIAATSVTTAELAAGHVRFVHDGSDFAPDIVLSVSDGIDSSAPFHADVSFTNASYHLTSTAGVSIDISGYGATDGFVLPGAGNVTTPGTPEDRIVLGYDLGGNHVVLNGAPMMGDRDFTPISSSETHTNDGSSSVSTVLGAGHDVTLTQTITLGEDANFFTTTIDIFNGGTSALTNVRFMRNLDPDQDVQAHNDFNTYNDVVHVPTASEPFAIVSATGIESGVQVALIGLGGDWRGSVFGFSLSNTDPYAAGAFDNPVDPNGAAADKPISLTYDFGAIGAGQHGVVTYITTTNVATAGSNALFGTSGADTINGLAGNDLLIGLGGCDNFVFTANFGHDTVLDFKSGQDHIDLSAVVTTNDVAAWMASHVTASPTAADTLITLGPDDTILLHNVAANSLTASDFIVHV
jgi:hypothetical protein